MNNSPDDLTPVIVGFELPEDLLMKLKSINQLFDGKIDFEVVVPHISLWMGFIPSKQIGSLNLGLLKIFQNVEMTLSFGETRVYSGDFGKVISTDVILSRSLHLFENRIHHFFEPFRESPEDFGCLDQATVTYLNNFNRKSLDQYDPHITIAFGDRVPVFELPKQFSVRDPRMFLAGNFCTCLSVIQ